MTTPLDKGCMAMEISSAVTDLVNDVKGMSEHKLAEAIQHLINATAEQTAGNLYRGSSAEPDASGLIEAAEHCAKQVGYNERAAEKLNSDYLKMKSKAIAQAYSEMEKWLRSRAADRSGK